MRAWSTNPKTVILWNLIAWSWKKKTTIMQVYPIKHWTIIYARPTNDSICIVFAFFNKGMKPGLCSPCSPEPCHLQCFSIKRYTIHRENVPFCVGGSYGKVILYMTKLYQRYGSQHLYKDILFTVTINKTLKLTLVKVQLYFHLNTSSISLVSSSTLKTCEIVYSSPFFTDLTIV